MAARSNRALCTLDWNLLWIGRWSISWMGRVTFINSVMYSIKKEFVFSSFLNMFFRLLELLPGIEEFLCQDLAGEKLSEETENKRLYYLERLDILKLPPSVPPRLKGKTYILHRVTGYCMVEMNTNRH